MTNEPADIDRLLGDQRQRWRGGEGVLVEEYLRARPALAADAGAVLLLINNELVLREARGEKPTLDEYLGRFRPLADELRVLFEVHRDLESGRLDGIAAEKPTAAEPAPPAPAHPAHPRDVPELVERLRRSGRASAAQLAELDGGLARQFAQPRALARELVRRQWLTPFQVNRLFKGDHLVLGDYVLQERLGKGGMGEVFKARHQKLGRVVALKVIGEERVTNPEVGLRFLREIRVTSQLSHPNIVLAYDAGEAAGRPFFAMEFVEGSNLARLVREKGRLPASDACAYVRQAALGLHHAHQRGLVHRDVKPSNLMVTPKGVVKLLDLGLARLLPHGDRDPTTITRPEEVMGTADYIPPEQVEESHGVDHRADVYSLGCTLYHLLAGHPPFVDCTLVQKLRKHQTA